MKSKITFAILLLFALKTTAQVNLITNGSFEYFSGSCPGGSPNGAFIQELGGWHPGNFISALGFIPSVDLYCGEPNYSNCMPGPVPTVGSNGTAYVGMHTRIYNPFYNESIYQILATPLITGDVYTISFDLMNCQSGLFINGPSDYAVYTNIDTVVDACPAATPGIHMVGFVPSDSISNVAWKRHSFSFVAPANSNIIAFSGDSCNVSEVYFYLDSVVLIHETSESVIELTNGFTFDINPNPATDVFNIEYVAKESKIAFIEIKNILGEEIYSEHLFTSIGRHAKMIDLSGISKGVYFVRIRNDKQVITKKFIKK